MMNFLGRMLIGVAVLGMAVRADARPLVIKVGSLVPEGTPWHQMLLKIKQDWARISGGQVNLRIYPGGILGDEPDMVKKLRIRQLHALGVTAVGLSLLDNGVLCLQIPLTFDSYDEFDYVREHMLPKLEARFEAKGFILLTWTDGGWVHFFTKKPVSTLNELRQQKLFVWAGDGISVELFTATKFRPVPLATTDMLPALQTGLINAFDAPPLAAMSNQWFGLAPNMIDVKWAPLLGGLVISKHAWGRIPADIRDQMLAAARDAGKQFSPEVRTMSRDAVPAMQRRGLNVVKVTATELKFWKSEVEKAYPLLRRKMGGAALCDEVRRLRDEYRARRARRARQKS